MKNLPSWQRQNSLLPQLDEAKSNAARLEKSAIFNAAMRQAESRQQALTILIDQSIVAFSADAVGVYHVEGDSLLYDAGKGLSIDPPTELMANANNVLGKAFFLNRILRFETEQSVEEDCDFCAHLLMQGLNCLLVIPLQTSQKVVGVMFIAFRQPIQLLPGDEQLLSAFSEAAGNTINRFMVTEQLEQIVTNRNLELSLIYNLLEIAGEKTDIEHLLQEALNRILVASDCTIGFIHLAAPSNQKLNIIASEQFPEEFNSFLEISGHSDRLWKQAYQKHEIVKVQNLPDRSSSEYTDLKRQYYMYLGIPIRQKSKAIGVLSLIDQSEQLLSPRVTQILISAANVLGLTIENINFAKQVEDAVILKERQRLGRNLHDSVSQSLYALVISADVSEKLLRIKDFPGLRQQLRDLGKTALQALKEMRLMLYEFRPVSFEPGNLVDALEKRINTVEYRAGIDASMTVDENLDLSPEMEHEIYQIAIEGLNNALKHSEATQIFISLHSDAEKIYLEIKDNGRGFDLSSRVNPGGMGLESMSERARILGGECSILSKPGEGTIIRFEAPQSRTAPNKESYGA